jgi:hypothetical protein
MSATFIVSVGNKEKEFTLHENHATRSSDFFRAAMSHDWKESREKKVVLADAKGDVFEGYLQWLSTGDITFHRNGSYSELADLYLLGDYLRLTNSGSDYPKRKRRHWKCTCIGCIPVTYLWKRRKQSRCLCSV